MDITIRQLEAFLAVAETEGFTRAAERIHLTQSAISVLIRELELQLQVRLFDRNTRSVNLTEAGRAFFPFVEKSLAELQTAIQNTRELMEKKRGRLIVAAPPLIASTLLPGVIAGFRRQYPGVTVILRDLLTDDIVLRVRNGEVDLGVGTFHLSDPGLAVAVKSTDRLVVLCPQGHPLLRKRKVRWRELAGYPMIALDRHSSLRQIVDKTLDAAACNQAPALEVSFVATAVGMVESGLGIAVLPAYAMLHKGGARIQSRDLTEPVVNRDIAVITARGKSLSPAAEAFVDELSRSLRLRKPGEK